MKNVIWGAGYYASLFTIQLGRENVAFYIDKDRSKKEKFGKRVVHPDDVTDWKDLFVYVPFNYYDEISSFLVKQGLMETVNFCRFEDRVFISIEQAEKEYERALQEAESFDSSRCQECFAVMNRFWDRKEAEILRDLIQKPDAMLISKAIWYSKEETEKLSKSTAVTVLPAFFESQVFIEDQSEKVTIYEDEAKDQAVSELAESIHLYHNDLSYRSCLIKAVFMHRFTDHFFSQHRFKTIVLDSSDLPENMLVEKILRKYGIPVLHCHSGVIPGTYYIDQGGDLGSSLPSLFPEPFKRLSVDDAEMHYAEDVCRFLYDNRVNRKAQPKTDWKNDVNQKIREGRPVIFCVGVNDRGCAMVPYTENSRRYHSPIYSSSFEMCAAIAQIAAAHDWNVIFKPHPMYVREDEVAKLPANVCYVEQADINDLIDYSDVVVTLGSSTSYIAQIRKKPVLMVGYNQNRGQGCAYEAYRAEDVEPQLCAAVEQGFTSAQQTAFVQHVARLLKYYLYDDMTGRPIRYGLPWPEHIEDFFALGDRLAAMKREDEAATRKEDAHELF